MIQRYVSSVGTDGASESHFNHCQDAIFKYSIQFQSFQTTGLHFQSFKLQSNGNISKSNHTFDEILQYILRCLNQWGRVIDICIGDLTIYASMNRVSIGSANGLSPGRRRAIIWTNDGMLLIGPLGTNFSEILIEVLIFSFRKMWFKVSSV